ncbi:hypothetical protein [Mitsuaria sp. GD03876]|uniref:hypothetical protein n=1 Tax=Mitsuaria sp. GD03876 TaxID=2975399 RepID=UPI002449F309|nr:hypothetical protein [Mitsuaria sp. GD03876]MDH0868004.1 hypothetical protein [Mitsuaria sp. GD03876]
MARRVAACHPLGVAAFTSQQAFGIAAVALMVAATPAQADCEATIHSAPGRVAFEGCIDQQSAQALIDVLERQPSARLLVRSGGGAVNAAIEAATVMARQRTRLTIRGQCLSSCANYWLPAAASVDVEEGSVIGFHGDARTTFQQDASLGSYGADAQRGMARVLDQEVQFGREVQRASDLHAVQALRVSAIPVRVQLGGRWMNCPGLGLPAIWAPTLERLRAMGLVHRVVARDEAFASTVPSGHDLHPMTAANDDSDPAAGCSLDDPKRDRTP